jgi:hypothetical protein
MEEQMIRALGAESKGISNKGNEGFKVPIVVHKKSTTVVTSSASSVLPLKKNLLSKMMALNGVSKKRMKK